MSEFTKLISKNVIYIGTFDEKLCFERDNARQVFIIIDSLSMILKKNHKTIFLILSEIMSFFGMSRLDCLTRGHASLVFLSSLIVFSTFFVCPCHNYRLSKITFDRVHPFKIFWFISMPTGPYRNLAQLFLIQKPQKIKWMTTNDIASRDNL